MALKTMNSYESFFANRLAKKVQEALENTVAQTMSGLPQDTYHQRIGAHRAYQDVIAMMQDVQTEINAPDPSRNRT